MTRPACTRSTEQLLEYWFGELDETAEQRMDEHLFGCGSCTERLRAIVDLGEAIHRVFTRGNLNLVVPEAFIARCKAAGLRVREYELEPGGAVDCTVTRDDDLVVAYLHAPLADVRRLDVLTDDRAVGTLRANDVAFDAAAGGLATITSTVFLRTLQRSQLRMRLVAVDGVQERVIADYTFNHYPS